MHIPFLRLVFNYILFDFSKVFVKSQLNRHSNLSYTFSFILSFLKLLNFFRWNFWLIIVISFILPQKNQNNFNWPNQARKIHIISFVYKHWSSRKAWPLITIFANSFSFSSSLYLGGKRKGKRITKVVVKSKSFLLDHKHFTPAFWHHNNLCEFKAL